MSQTELTAALEQDLEVNGLKLHVGTWGNFTSPERTVMLVHGLTANYLSWATLGPTLAAQGWYAIAPDLRGRGLSGKPTHGYGIPYHVNDLLALSDHFKLPRVNLVGHSLGALITMFHAAIHPQRTGKIVLIDAGGKIPEDAVQAIGVSLSRLGTVYPTMDAYLDVFRQSSIMEWNSFWESYVRYDADILPDGRVTSRVQKASIMEEITVNALLRTDVLPNSIKSPTMIVRATVGLLGPDKGLLLPLEEAERLRTLIPGSRVLEIPGTNHYTVITAELFNREVASFLNS